MSTNQTAILLFANSAQTEACNKPIKGAEPLFNALNDRILNIVKQSGFPFVVCSDDVQKGYSFGEKFTNALQSVYDSGFENIIAIGNDTPHLTAKHLTETARKLKTNPIVLGPSLDGGFYLMGLNRQLFKRETFLKLPWQTSRLNRSILRVLSGQDIQIHFLERLNDIDTASDIEKILQKPNGLTFKIRKILKEHKISIQSEIDVILLHIDSFFIEHVFNKGSPLRLHF